MEGADGADDIGAAAKADITSREDLSMAVMNLISVEEHLAFTAMKTQDESYLEILKEVRKTRVSLMKELLVSTDGELWCISKHLLASTMRLMETSTKYMDKDVKRALRLERNAFDLYSLFWLLQNMGGKNDAGKPEKKTKAKGAGIKDA